MGGASICLWAGASESCVGWLASAVRRALRSRCCCSLCIFDTQTARNCVKQTSKKRKIWIKLGEVRSERSSSGSAFDVSRPENVVGSVRVGLRVDLGEHDN